MKNCDAHMTIKNGGLSLNPKSTKSQIWKVCSKEVISFCFPKPWKRISSLI